MLDNIKETFNIMTNVKVKKDWSTLEKNDKLYLMVPYVEEGITKYEFQESHVINVHHYDCCTNIRFKYIDKEINRRRRVELCVNQLKYDKTYLFNDKRTGWAQNNLNQYGDLIVTYINPELLNKVYFDLINNKIKEQEELIKSKMIYIEQLKSVQNDKIV